MSPYASSAIPNTHGLCAGKQKRQPRQGRSCRCTPWYHPHETRAAAAGTRSALAPRYRWATVAAYAPAWASAAGSGVNFGRLQPVGALSRRPRLPGRFRRLLSPSAPSLVIRFGLARRFFRATLPCSFKEYHTGGNRCIEGLNTIPHRDAHALCRQSPRLPRGAMRLVADYDRGALRQIERIVPAAGLGVSQQHLRGGGRAVDRRGDLLPAYAGAYGQVEMRAAGGAYDFRPQRIGAARRQQYLIHVGGEGGAQDRAQVAGVADAVYHEQQRTKAAAPARATLLRRDIS